VTRRMARRSQGTFEKGKGITRLRDELSGNAGAPWVRVERSTSSTAEGKETLANLFGGRSQLVVIISMPVRGGSRVARAALSGIISTPAVIHRPNAT